MTSALRASAKEDLGPFSLPSSGLAEEGPLFPTRQVIPCPRVQEDLRAQGLLALEVKALFCPAPMTSKAQGTPAAWLQPQPTRRTGWAMPT